jgi:DNA-binding FadR family transcriptional regulator
LTQAEDDNEFEQLDTRFHLELAEVTHNGFFRDGVERVRLHLNASLAALPASRLWHERSLTEHEAIVAAIEAGDAELARDAMRVHVDNTDQSIRALLAAL